MIPPFQVRTSFIPISTISLEHWLRLRQGKFKP
jgi:hypothetical protein